jgi:urocanate hydratase
MILPHPHYHIAMPVESEIPTASYIRAPRGTTLSCKGWQQEAAMRMFDE